MISGGLRQGRAKPTVLDQNPSNHRGGGAGSPKKSSSLKLYSAQAIPLQAAAFCTTASGVNGPPGAGKHIGVASFIGGATYSALQTQNLPQAKSHDGR